MRNRCPFESSNWFWLRCHLAMNLERRKMASSGSKYRCQDSLGISCGKVGEMAEWFKAHAWKACVGNTTVSSNLTLSATPLAPRVFNVCRVQAAAGPIH